MRLLDGFVVAYPIQQLSLRGRASSVILGRHYYSEVNVLWLYFLREITSVHDQLTDDLLFPQHLYDLQEAVHDWLAR